jgi:hypothetical protein
MGFYHGNIMGYTVGFHKTWLDNPLGLLGKSSRNNGLFSKPLFGWDFGSTVGISQQNAKLVD